MPVTPNQIRAVDPYSESRFSDNYNLRSRMVTGGRDVILFPDSFAITWTPDSTSFIVGPGIAIMDDVLVHIMEDTEFDLSNDTNAMIDNSQSSPPIPTDETSEFQLKLCLQYKYARTIPPQSAQLGLIRVGLPGDPVIDPDSYLLIADITVHLGITNIIITPSLWESDIDCGVIRIDPDTSQPYWFLNWTGTSTKDEPLTILP